MKLIFLISNYNTNKLIKELWGFGFLTYCPNSQIINDQKYHQAMLSKCDAVLDLTKGRTSYNIDVPSFHQLKTLLDYYHGNR